MTSEDRDIILQALDVFIAQLEEQRREHTYSAIVESRIKALRRARAWLIEQPD